MKLYLCGGGSGKEIINAYNRFSKKIDKSKPILYVPLAMNENKYNNCFNWFKEEIKYMNVKRFDMVSSSQELSEKDFSLYSAIFIGGGNTYKLLNELKKNSNYEKIIEYLKNDGTIFGSSAGAIVFGKDINCCKLDDKNYLNLQDTKGLNFLNNYSILCHLKNKNLRRNKDYLKEYSQKNKVIYLREDNCLVIENKKISIIGNKKYMVLKNGLYEYHNFANLRKDML